MKHPIGRPIGIYGGTFNPPHYGHLCPVEEAARQVAVSQVLLMPCKLPPHKQEPNVSAQVRLEMATLAARHFACFEVSDLELTRPGPSYTADTLSTLREANPDTPLCFFMGLDSLLSLDTWYRWRDLVAMANIVVCMRPGWQPEYNISIRELLAEHHTDAVEDLHTHVAGKIFFAATTPVHVSSTDIRQRLRHNQNTHGMMPDEVHAFILQHGLYQS